MANYRSGRINEGLKREISNIIANDIKDPRVSAMVSVTHVNATKDLHYAKVSLSIFGTEYQKEETLDAIKHSSGFIRKMLADRIEIRHIPELTFIYDESIEYGKRIEQIIENINENKEQFK